MDRLIKIPWFSACQPQVPVRNFCAAYGSAKLRNELLVTNYLLIVRELSWFVSLQNLRLRFLALGFGGMSLG